MRDMQQQSVREAEKVLLQAMQERRNEQEKPIVPGTTSEGLQRKGKTGAEIWRQMFEVRLQQESRCT
jgi:hypothetical protein